MFALSVSNDLSVSSYRPYSKREDAAAVVIEQRPGSLDLLQMEVFAPIMVWKQPDRYCQEDRITPSVGVAPLNFVLLLFQFVSNGLFGRSLLPMHWTMLILVFGAQPLLADPLLATNIWTLKEKHGCAAALEAGVDLSSLAGNLKSADTFHATGTPSEGLGIFKAHGYDWFRIRTLVPATESDASLQELVGYVKAAKSARYKVLLDLHFSDRLTDPNDQHTPADWGGGDQTINHAVLYTTALVNVMKSAKAMPDMLQIGNEINNGVLWPSGHLPEHWDFVARFIKAEEKAIDIAAAPEKPPKFLIHVACGNLGCSLPFFRHLTDAGVSFDVIGLSFYLNPWVQLNDLASSLAELGKAFKKPIYVVETAYRWKPSPISNISPEAATREGQRIFFRDVVEIIADSQWGCGVFWWEPTALEPDLIGRGLFDDDRIALPAFYVIDEWRNRK